MPTPSVELTTFLPSRLGPLDDQPLVVAFSGGVDSLALLLVARDVAGVRLVAAHLDHGLVAGSAERARRARRLAEELGVEWVAERRAVALGDSGAEAAARRVRYEFLVEVARRLGSRAVLTGHHLEDQAETVALRLLQGSGLEGLAAMATERELAPGVLLLRPLLDRSRAQLGALVAAHGLRPIEDPSNRDLQLERNFVRHRLLPHLQARQREDPRADPPPHNLRDRLVGVSLAARRVRSRLDAVLARDAPLDDDGTLALADLEALPPGLRPFALARLHRAAGRPYPPSRRAQGELTRQLDRRRARPVSCDCGDGWRWRQRGERLAVQRPEPKTARFTYTLTAPGEVEIDELGARFRLTRGTVESWMFQGAPNRAGLALPIEPGDIVTVRNRRSGDRLQPLGSSGRRKLKDLLIDRQVPRHDRDRIPLLCLGEDSRQIAWVPGVTMDDRFRIGDQRIVWIAELEPAR
ncbi:MAG: tRNA lysidine(34) synthetase TilS [Acidobacteriota bacterium]